MTIEPIITRDPSPPNPHTHTIVFLHGRGDNAVSFANSLGRSYGSDGRSLIDAFPSVRWVFPQAPTRILASDPRMRWPQWFDVWDVRDFASREELQTEGLREVVPEVRDLLAREAAALGGRYDRVVLAGISMGAATGVHTLFNLNAPAAAGGRLGAFIGFSGRCPFAGRSLAEMRKELGIDGAPGHDDVIRKTPVLLEHCVDDPLVKVQFGRRLRDTLTAFGARVDWKEYSSGGHWFKSPEGMDDAVRFLKREVFAQDLTEATSVPDHSRNADVMDIS